MHLWEIDHPYYCNEGNYFSNETVARFKRWQDFESEMGDADLDYNMLFRWDWEAPHVDEDCEKPIEWRGDENYRDSILKLFFMGQRKGCYFCHIVDVCRADEPMVREYLAKRFDYLMKLWTPFGARDVMEVKANA